MIEKSMSDNQSFAIIGYGAITEEIVAALKARSALGRLAGVLVRPSSVERAISLADNRFKIYGTLDELLDTDPDLIIEAAGQQAVAECGPRILTAGRSLLLASTGILANHGVAEELASATRGQAGIWIPSGAVAGVDGLLAVRTCGLGSATYTSLKPPEAWRGTEAEIHLTKSNTTQRYIFFEGSARDAARRFPQNANVAATVGLAGLGLDKTGVQLGWDPDIPGPLGVIKAAGAFGELRCEMMALPSPKNPKTSAVTGHSLVAAALQGMCFQAFA